MQSKAGGRQSAGGALSLQPSPLPLLRMLSRLAMLLGGLLLVVASVTVAQRRGQEAGGRRRAHRVQHGQCSYTFVLPEPEPCPPEPEPFGGSNSLQRDSPAAALNLGDWPAQRVRQLEKVLENNTQWLQKVRAGPAGAWCGEAQGPVPWRGGGSSPEVFPSAKIRLIEPVALICTDWANGEQRETGMALMPHSKTRQAQSWKPGSLIHSLM